MTPSQQFLACFPRVPWSRSWCSCLCLGEMMHGAGGQWAHGDMETPLLWSPPRTQKCCGCRTCWDEYQAGNIDADLKTKCWVVMDIIVVMLNIFRDVPYQQNFYSEVSDLSLWLSIGSNLSWQSKELSVMLCLAQWFAFRSFLQPFLPPTARIIWWWINAESGDVVWHLILLIFEADVMFHYMSFHVM